MNAPIIEAAIVASPRRKFAAVKETVLDISKFLSRIVLFPER